MKSNQKITNEIDNVLKKLNLRRMENYVNNHTPFKCEKDGYWYDITWCNLQRGEGLSLFGINNPYLEHNIKNLINKKYKNIQYISHKIVTKNNKKRILVSLQCECGNLFIKDAYQLKNNKQICCNYCANKNRIKKIVKDKSEIINDFAEYGYKIITPENKMDTRQTELLIEDCFGYRGYLSHNHLKNGRRLSFYGKNNNKLKLYNINNYFKLNNYKCLAINMIDDKQVKIKCECGECFNVFAYKVLSGKRAKCKKCSRKQSTYEYKVESFLKEKNIQYISEFIIHSCKDILPLPFDFQLPDYNILIEVDGEQHFKAISAFGGQDGFEYIKRHDNIKNEYCKKYNIPLLRISYIDIENNTYQNKILNFIQTVQD